MGIRISEERLSGTLSVTQLYSTKALGHQGILSLDNSVPMLCPSHSYVWMRPSNTLLSKGDVCVRHASISKKAEVHSVYAHKDGSKSVYLFRSHVQSNAQALSLDQTHVSSGTAQLKRVVINISLQ